MRRGLTKIIFGPSFWVFLFLFGLQRTVDADLGWNVRVGEWITNFGKVPTCDLFSFWAKEHPYVYHAWLSQLLIFLFYKNFGFWGLTFFFTAILLLSLFFLERLVRQVGGSKFWARILILLVTPTFLTGIFTRPQMFSFLFANIVLFCLFKFVSSPVPLLVVLPAIFALWVNLHGGFSLGLVLILTFFIGTLWQKFKKGGKIAGDAVIYFFLFILSLLATCLSPFGLRSYHQLFSMLGNPFYSHLHPASEWMPLLSRGTQHQVFAILVLIILVLPALARSLRINWSIWGLALTLFILTLRVSRLSLFLLIPLPILLSQILPFLEKKLTRKFRLNLGWFEKFYLKIATLLLVLSLLFRVGLNFNRVWQENQNEQIWSQGLESAGVIFPHQAVKFLEDKSPLPRPFNDIGWGGYLIWQLPKQKVFAVGGMDSYRLNGRFLLEDYLHLYLAQNDYLELIDQYQIESIFLPPFSPLAQVLAKNSDWERVYQDQTALILVKKGVK